MFHFDGANVSECRKYDLLTFCEIIFGGPTGGPFGDLRVQVSGVRSQELMLSLTRFAPFLTDAIAYNIFILLIDAIAYQIVTSLTDAIAYQIFTFLIVAIAYQICAFYF